MYLYAIKDEKADCFSPPFHADNDVKAIRMAEQIYDDPKTALNKYPGDFSLWKVGAFVTSDGSILPDRRLLVSISSFIKVGQNA